MVGGVSREVWLRVVDLGVEEFEVSGVAGEPIRLPIATGPATGHRWNLELPEGVVRIEDERGRAVDPAVRLGGAAGGNLQVMATSGEHVIIARLARPWEPDQSVRVVRILLHVH